MSRHALHDQHLHSRYSIDSKADPAENCRQAIASGLSGLTFTEHYDTHPSEWKISRWDYDAISEMVDQLREQFGDHLRVGLGIEVDYQPEQIDNILSYLDAHSFDVVLLSVHWWDGKPKYKLEHWANLDWQRETEIYFATVLEATKVCLEHKRVGSRTFDILSHVDLVKRYSQRYCQEFDIISYSDILDEIWRTAIAAELVPEVNTSTMRDSVGEPMPADWAVKRYVELGGKQISFGSDAHQSKHVGSHFSEVSESAARCGIESQVVFMGREAIHLELPQLDSN